MTLSEKRCLTSALHQESSAQEICETQGWNRSERSHRAFYHTGVSSETPAFGVRIFDTSRISTFQPKIVSLIVERMNRTTRSGPHGKKRRYSTDPKNSIRGRLSLYHLSPKASKKHSYFRLAESRRFPPRRRNCARHLSYRLPETVNLKGSTFLCRMALQNRCTSMCYGAEKERDTDGIP